MKTDLINYLVNAKRYHLTLRKILRFLNYKAESYTYAVLGQIVKHPILNIRNIRINYDPNDEGLREAIISVLISDFYTDIIDTHVKMVVDAGAHQGLFTLLAIKHLKARKVLAIEPEKSNILKLARNVALNKAGDYVICINCALGAHDYIGTLYVSGSSHLHTIINGCNSVRDKVKVHIFKLDTLAKILNVDFIDLLKLDVEGAEYEALKGSKKLLENRRMRTIVGEIHSEYIMRNSVKLLKDHGYSVDIYKLSNTIRIIATST